MVDRQFIRRKLLFAVVAHAFAEKFLKIRGFAQFTRFGALPFDVCFVFIYFDPLIHRRFFLRQARAGSPPAPPADETPDSPPAEDTTPVAPPADTTPEAPPADDTPDTPPPAVVPGCDDKPYEDEYEEEEIPEI